MADSPVQTDITIVQGQTKAFSATWAIDDVPKSLAGYQAHLQVRKRAGNYTSPPLVDVSSVDGSHPANVVIEPSEETGKVKVRLPGSLTALLTRNAWYDLFVVNAEDTTERVRLVFGRVLVSKSATDNSAFAALVADVDPIDTGTVPPPSSPGGNSDVTDEDLADLQRQIASLQDQIDSLPEPVSTADLVTTIALGEAVAELQRQIDSLPAGGASLPDPTLPKPAAPVVEDLGIGRRVVQWSGLDVNGEPMPEGFERVDVWGRPGSTLASSGNFDTVPDVDTPDGPIDFSPYSWLTPIGASAFESTYDADLDRRHLTPAVMTTDLTSATAALAQVGNSEYAAVRGPDLPVPGDDSYNAVRWQGRVVASADPSAVVITFGDSPDDDRCVAAVLFAAGGTWTQAVMVDPDGGVQSFALDGGSSTFDVIYTEHSVTIASNVAGFVYDMPDLGAGHVGSAVAIPADFASGIVSLSVNPHVTLSRGANFYLGSLAGGGTLIPTLFYWTEVFLRPVTMAGTVGPDSDTTASIQVTYPATQQDVSGLQAELQALRPAARVVGNADPTEQLIVGYNDITATSDCDLIYPDSPQPGDRITMKLRFTTDADHPDATPVFTLPLSYWLFSSGPALPTPAGGSVGGGGQLMGGQGYFGPQFMMFEIVFDGQDWIVVAGTTGSIASYGPPAGLATPPIVGANFGQIIIQASEGMGSPPAGMVIERALSPDGPFVEVFYDERLGNTYTDTDVELGTAYYYRCRFRNQFGETEPSDIITSAEPAPPANAPTFELNYGSGAVFVDVERSAPEPYQPQGVGFYLYRATQPDMGDAVQINATFSGNIGWYDGGLTPGDTYYYSTLFVRNTPGPWGPIASVVVPGDDESP